MANKADNIYVELFEAIPIPERLKPENIAAMLAQETRVPVASPEITVTENIPKRAGLEETPDNTSHERKITKTSNKRKTSTAFRSIASLAACAALAFGVAGYMGVFDKEIPIEPDKGGAQFAENYDDLHKTFEEYYVGNEEKKTLDSAIADIEHSYNDAENESQNNSAVTTTQPIETEPPVSTENPTTTAPAPAPDVPDNTAPAVTEKEDDPEVEEINPPEDIKAPDPEPNPEPAPETEPAPAPEDKDNNTLPIPKNKAADHSNDVKFGDGFMVEEKNGGLRIFRIGGGAVDLTDTVLPELTPGFTKTLSGFYTDGTKLTVVYSVAADSDYPFDASVNDLLDSLYGPQPSASGYSVQVRIYSVVDGKAYPETDFSQDGSLVDMIFQNGALYLVTAYNDYRNAPIVGVDDLRSYVPGYTLNGARVYVDAQNIMIPDYLSTTDYTVISGLTTSGGISVQAVLGYEGRVILKNGAVYLFGYDNTAGSDVTSAKVFSLANGQVIYAGYKDIQGVALSGDGISLFGNSIVVTSVANTIEGYITSVEVYDGVLNLVSRVYLTGALTNVERQGDILYLSGARERYAVNLTDPGAPSVEIMERDPDEDPAEGLVEIDGGYVTLTKNSEGELIISKLSKNAGGDLRLDYQTVICEHGGTSKALDDNGLLFVSGSTVGVPYGYFDGLDYNFRYSLYRAGASGFENVGEIEVHEADEDFENGPAFLNGGYLYIFSEGRIYCAGTAEGLSIAGTANLKASAYSGHR